MGNILAETNGAGETTTRTFDDNFNELTRTDALGNTSTWTYDAKRNELSETDALGNTNSYTYNNHSKPLTITYLVDQNRPYAQVIAELDDTSTPTLFFTYGDDLISQTRNNQSHYYLYDGLGSTRGLSDESGATTDTYAYRAFGELEQQTGITLNDYLFAGEQRDGELGQYYLRARYYNQNQGRFTQQDTWMGSNSDPITLHKYLYANANPVHFIDPSGYFGIVGIVDIGFSFGASSVIRTTSISAAKGQFQRILFGRPPGDLGIVGEFILDNAINSVLDIVGIDDFKNKGAAGTRAHTNLENRIKAYKPIAGISIDAEVFVDKSGGEVNTREKGSLGIDILIKRNGKNVLGIDLKTGRGFSKTKRRALTKRLGVPIVQIFIGVR